MQIPPPKYRPGTNCACVKFSNAEELAASPGNELLTKAILCTASVVNANCVQGKAAMCEKR